MPFSVNASGKLLRDGRLVEQIPARENHMGRAFDAVPRTVVMHFTFGGTGRSSANWFRDPTNTGRSSAQIVVDRDGSVIQCVPFTRVAHHAGRSAWKGKVGMNQYALGIELANWGNLTRRATSWVSWTGRTTIPDPVMAVHRSGNPDGSTSPIGWEPFPEAQIDAAAAITRALVAAYGVNEIIGHDDISRGRKWDPGPAFDMTAFRSRVMEDMGSAEDDVLHVDVAEGLNLRRGPGTSFEVIELLANRTPLRAVEQQGNWLFANVLSGAGVPTQSGWVHAAFVA